MNNSIPAKVFGLFFVTLITLSLILLGFSPGMAASSSPIQELMPGRQVIL